MAARLELYGVVDGHHLERYDDDVLLAAQQDAPTPVQVQQRLDTNPPLRPATDECPLFAGFVSASDDDEQALFDLLGEIAEHTAFDARQHGCGVLPPTDAGHVFGQLHAMLRESNHAREAEDRHEATAAESWLGALTLSTQLVCTEGNSLAWRMHYDRGGSTDDGPDEFPTAHS